MNPKITETLSQFIERLGLEEEPVGIFYTDNRPEAGFSPVPGELPTREKEVKNEIEWQTVFGQFSCAIGHIWRARRKKTTAWFDAEHFGCPGAAFWLGFMKPQTETIIHYVSTGIPDHMKGECYCDSPDELRRVFEYINPRPAPALYCVVKPLSLFTHDEKPELVSFFTRPEPLCGLHQLAFFVTNNPEITVSPWGPGCGNLITWPLRYLDNGKEKAVVGGWDPSARKFFKTDELSFTVSYSMFNRMIERYEESFVGGKTWDLVRKKAERSRRAWGA